MFSKSCQYALQAVLYIALYGSKESPAPLKAIAKSQDIPLHFLGKIMQNLSRSKILASVPGPRGGFYLAQPAADLHLIRIVEVINGLDIITQCGIGFKKCSDTHPCPLHEEFKAVKVKIKELLTQKSLAELCDDVVHERSFVSFNRNAE